MSELALKLIAENKAKHARGEDARHLDLGNCGLTELPDLSDMDWLETLILSSEWWEFDIENNEGKWNKSINDGTRNQFRKIAPEHIQLPHLKKLMARNTDIKNSDFVGNLSDLIMLDLSGSHITDWAFLKKTKHIISLYLIGSQIHDGRILEHLSQLKVLNLGINRLRHGHFLEKMTNLTTLFISSNPISNWRFLERMPNLTTLDLSNNAIVYEHSLSNLTALSKLYLNDNKIQDGHFLQKLTNLTSLELGNNQIGNTNFLKNFSQLTSLDLGSNQVEDANFLKYLPNLINLKLRNNKIRTWNLEIELPKLTYLDLRSNYISNGHFLGNLTNLTELFISGNQISDLHFLRKLTNLTNLYLGSNQISDLKPLLPLIKKGILVTLKQQGYGGISLYNNPLSNPPLEIAAQGTDAILRYFEELETTKAEDIRPLNEAKLIVIGQPRAGKTSLRYKLCDTEREMPQQDDSTRGIDIELQSFPYTDEAGASQSFQYHIWDFGGQQIYHATHRFFLTKRTVYVAVVDTDVNDKQNDLDYWLHMIELMGDGSPVLLVQNQKNDRSIEISDALRNRFRNILVAKDYELNLARLQQQKNPKFDAQRLADFQRFKKDIQHIFEQQAPILMTRPKNDTRRALERVGREKPVLELAEYRAVCAENSLQDPLAQTDLLRTLHHLGICLWYEGYDFLERIVILQNRWATDAVFKVLDNETVKKDKGHFRRKQLNQIWVAEEYQNRVSELVELMKQFKLCYQIDQSDEYIVPQLLDKNPPAGFSRDNIRQGGVRMVIEYEFMPRGIMTQFIVAMHRQISGGQRHAWETGFAVQSQQGPPASGMAEESYDSRKLELWAKGPGAGLLLQQMLGELNKIHDSFNRLRYNKLIPCNCTRCAAPGATRIKEFDYDEILIEMYENRQPGIRCSYGNQTVPFDQLLGVLGFTAQQTERDFWRGERGGELNIHVHVEDRKTHEMLEELKRSTEIIEHSTHVIQSNQHVHTRLLRTVLDYAEKEQALLKDIFTKMEALPEADNSDLERIDAFLKEQFGKLLERLPDEHKIVAAWKEAMETVPHETDMKWTLKFKIPLIFAEFEKDLSWDGKKMLKSIREEWMSFAKGERSFRELFLEG